MFCIPVLPRRYCCPGMLGQQQYCMRGPLPHWCVCLYRLLLTAQGGFIWLFYGSRGLAVRRMRPPIPCVAELEDPSWKARVRRD